MSQHHSDANSSMILALSLLAVGLAVLAVFLGLDLARAAIVGLAAGVSCYFILPLLAVQAKKRDFERQRKTGLKALKASDIMAAIPEPVLIFDARFTLLHANQSANQVFIGLENGIALSRWFRDPDTRTAVERMIETGMPVQFTYRERRPDDKLFSAFTTPLDGESGLYLLVFRDESNAQRLDKIRSDFIANASHELRTPLAAVSGFLETLQGPARNDAANRDRFVSIMLEQTGRMSRLIDDLLSLSTLESKAAPANLDLVDLGKIAQAVTASLESTALRNNVIIQNNVPLGVNFVRGASDEITQVVQNLVENACKYGSDGGKVEILPVRDTTSDDIGLAIKDYGKGIAPEHIPRLTERFYRVDVETSREKKGTGLGLSIVRHILIRHRARMTIESTLGTGSTFTILFPKQ